LAFFNLFIFYPVFEKSVMHVLFALGTCWLYYLITLSHCIHQKKRFFLYHILSKSYSNITEGMQSIIFSAYMRPLDFSNIASTQENTFLAAFPSSDAFFFYSKRSKNTNISTNYLSVVFVTYHSLPIYSPIINNVVNHMMQN